MQARLLATHAQRPDEVLLALNREDRRRHDVYRVNLRRGSCELDTVNPGGVVGWIADARLRVRAALASTPEGGFRLLAREDEGADWRELRRWGPDEHGHPLFFSEDGRRLHVLANHDAETNRLLAIDVGSGDERVLAEDPDYDVVDALHDPPTGAVHAALVSAERPRWLILDPCVADDFAALDDALGDGFRVLGQARGDRSWLLSSVSDRRPPAYHLYERAAGRITPLFDDRSEIDGHSFAPMTPISLRARDGMILHGYLTVPLERAGGPMPAVLDVHGGPWARDTWGFDATVQWLANRGYVVLQVNYRGSSGYGKRFLTAGHRDWGRKMQDDLTDAARWLVDEGLADRTRIGIMGASYGGYATLAALSLTPEVFAAGVSLFGPCDLLSFVRNVPDQWSSLRALLHARVGHPEADAERLRRVSPLEQCARIRAPLFIAQGANDARVRREESDRLVSALRGAGRTIEYLVYTDEGHGFARPGNRLHLCGRIEAFLARHLGGRFEPEEHDVDPRNVSMSSRAPLLHCLSRGRECR